MKDILVTGLMRPICYGIMLVGILTIPCAWYLGVETFIGLYILIGAALALAATFIPWKSLFQSGNVGHRPAKTTHSGSTSNMFAGFGGWIQEHILPIAGSALGVAGLLFWWLASRQEDFKVFALIGFILMMFGAGALLQHARKLEKTLKGWAKQGLPATGFVVSLVIASWLAHNAYLDELSWWEQPSVWMFSFITFLFGLATIGKLKAFLENCGKGIALFLGIIGKTLAFQHGAFIALLLWATILIGGGVTSFSVSKLDLFEDIEGLPQVVFDVMKFVIAIGFFLVVFSPLAFMGKKKK